jgi:hypothetical protein
MTPPDVDWKQGRRQVVRESASRSGPHASARRASRSGWRSWTWLGGLAAAAAMAALAIAPVTSRAHEPASVGATVEGLGGRSHVAAGFGRRKSGRREGANAAHMRSAGETIDTHGARALFEAEGRVSWLLENESKVQDRANDGSKPARPSFWRSLEGAVEAQVTPVASGEAFAIDVEGVRIAVHGTHLRVARDGDHVSSTCRRGRCPSARLPRSGRPTARSSRHPRTSSFKRALSPPRCQSITTPLRCESVDGTARGLR